jgi:hypothetical protein
MCLCGCSSSGSRTCYLRYVTANACFLSVTPTPSARLSCSLKSFQSRVLNRSTFQHVRTSAPQSLIAACNMMNSCLCAAVPIVYQLDVTAGSPVVLSKRMLGNEEDIKARAHAMAMAAKL